MFHFPRRFRARRGPLAALVAAALFLPLQSGVADAQAQARFTVTSTPVAEAGGPLQPLTATIGTLSEGFVPVSPADGAMEPVQLRTWFEVEGGTARSLTASRDAITFDRRFASPIFDGAEVDILRLRNGQFTRIRTARIAPGGHQPNAWSFLHWPRRLLEPDTTSARIEIPRNWRDGASVHLGLVAVDVAGRLSPIGMSNPVITSASADRQRPAQQPRFFNSRKFGGLEAERSLLVSAPSGLRAEIEQGAITLTWDRPGLVSGMSLHGYAVFYSFDGPADLGPSTLVFETDGPAPQAGDLAILRAEVTEFARDRAQAPDAWHDLRRANPASHAGLLHPLQVDSAEARARLVAHAPDTPVSTPGTHFLRAEVHPASPFEIKHYSLGPTVSPFRHPLKPGVDMELSFWARAPEGDATAVRYLIHDRAAAVDSLTGRTLRGGHAVSLGRDWQRYSLRFRATAPEVTTPVLMTVLLEGTGTVDIDNIFLTEAADPPGHATEAFTARLRDASIGYLRTHGTIKTGIRTYSLAQLAGIPAGTSGVGLHPLLSLMDTVGAKPWLQIEPHLSAEEWLGLVEYLAAPWDPQTDSAATKPYAALRVAQGRLAPWTDSFDRMILELGNEMWNGLFAPWVALPLRDGATGDRVGAPEMLGAYQAYVLDVMAQSPYWAEVSPKLDTVIGGWARRPDFGTAAVEAAARAGRPVDYAGIAVYVGGWDEGEGVVQDTPAGFTSVLSSPAQAAVPRVHAHRAALAALAQRGLPVPDLIMYEGGPGYSLNGLNRQRVSEEQAARQERVLKSKASGTTTLEVFLATSQAGMRLQNFFNYRFGNTWSSHAPSGLGGHAYPAWDWSTLLGRDIRGEFLEVRTDAVPRVTFPALEQREALPDAPLVALYALRDGARLTLVAISRQIPGAPGVAGTGTAEVQIALPVRTVGGLSRLHMPGRYDDHDVSENVLRIERDTLPPPDTPAEMRFQLEPGAAVVYVLEDVVWN